MAIATAIAGRPTLTATGKRTAPINATAGDGQKKKEMIIINKPMTQYAKLGDLIHFAKGDIMTSLIPVFVRILLIATMMEMTTIVGSNSVIA